MALFTGFIPSVNQTNVPRTSIVGFTILTDGYGGAQVATLDVNIDGYQAILNGAFVNGYNGNIYPSTGKYVIGVYPKSPFLSSAASIGVSLSILDSYSTLDAYDYNFYTAGYGAVPVTDPIVIVPGGICDQTKPFFPPSDLGLRAALDTGTGTEVELQWKQAYPYNEDNIIYYNIYVSSDRRTVYDRKPDFIADNTSIVIGGLAPGEQHFFAVAAAEFNPILHTLNGLRQVGTNLYLHPDTFINVNTTETNTLIRVDSVEGFPEYGIIYVGTELIYYTSLQEYPPAFITSASGRGYYGSIAETHAVNSEVRLYRGKEDNNTIIAQSEPSFQKPFEPITWELTDGYGPDGYRDGYDGYDAYYSNGIAAIYNVFDGVDGYYRHRQEVRDSLTTDGKNNDQSGAFPRFDYCGTYRTHSPYGFMRTGSCTNTYFGGVQKRNGVPVRVPDIRTHMLQREELLLESTGEPFVLLRKMWTGMRCMCSMHRREHADARCPSCFTPDTLINTKNGFIPIKDITVGDEVLADDGSYRKVLKTMSRDYDGYMYNIETYTSNPIMVTPEHPFLSIVSNHNIIVPCGPICDKLIQNGDGANRDVAPRLVPSGKWLARATDINGSRISLGTFENKHDADLVIQNYHKMNILPLHKLDWKNAEDLVIGDWLENKCSRYIKDMSEIVIPKEYTKQTKLGSIRNGVEKFAVDKDFLWMIGLYLAEGSVGTRQINFSLHKNETEYQNKIINYFNKLGFSSSISQQVSENGVCVEIYSTTLSQWFPMLLGKKCYNKKIPQFLMDLPNDKIKYIIQGIWDGDGNKKYNEIGQTSKILALQIIEILHRLGKQPTLRHQKSNTLTPAGNERKLCYIVSWEEETLGRNNRKNRWDFKKEELLTRIKNISKSYYSGKVYNLEVEDRHTYVVENIVVHNCFGTGFVQGYVQFFNPRKSDRRILVRVDPSTDDLNLVDRGGFEPHYEPGAWTLPYPALKDRDVLVRFNPDNTEEFRYEILSVERNRAFFIQTGAQKFRIKRIPKTDIMYQFPIVRDTRPIPGGILTSINSASGIDAHQHSIIMPQGANIITLKVATLEAEGHNHIVYNGIVQSVLGHTHII